MPEQGEVDLAFAKIAVLRRQVTQENVQECFRTLGQLAMQGVEKSIADIMVEKSLIPQAEAEAIIKMVEAGQTVPELPGYTLLHELGRGGMGAVYKGLQTALDRKVAIKILFPELARNEKYLTRFLNEAKAVAKLQHPNIVSAIDIGEAGGFHYFAMEFVEGETVAALIRKGPFPEDRALDIAQQTARALEHAWKHKLVHRDVKPENILITPDGQAKLADLGIAKQVDSDMSLTMEGGVVGSPNYISPEQANGAKDIDTRSDIYSLGATLYFMLIGEAPYKGDTAAQVMAQHMVAKLPDPREKRKDLSAGVCRLIEKMMAKDRAQRQADPTALIKEIDALKSGAQEEIEVVGEPGAEKGRAPGQKLGAGAAAQRGGSQANLAAVQGPSSRQRSGMKGPGARGSSVEMKRIGTAEVRAMSNKEASARLGGRPPGLNPMWIVGGVVALVAIAGLWLAMGPKPSANGGKTNVPVANASNQQPANVVPVPGNGTAVESAQDREAREAFEYVASFEKANPDRWADLIEKYGKVEERYGGSTWGFKAGDASKRVREAWKGKIQQEIAALEKAIAPMLEESRFADARKEFETRMPPDRVPELAREDVNRLWSRVLDTAQAKFQALTDQASASEKSGKWEDAFAAYKQVVTSFGFPEFVNLAKEKLAAAEQAAAVAKAQAVAEAERTLRSRFNEKVRIAREQAARWEFTKAIAAVDAEKGFKDTPYAAEFATLRKDLERLQQFKATMIAQITAKKIKVETRSFLSQDLQGHLSGASEDKYEVSVKGGGKLGYEWKTLKPEESFNLARAAVDRSDPAAPAVLATFALTLGMVEKAQAELKGNHPDVVELQKRLQAEVERQGLAEMDATMKKVEVAIDGHKYDEAEAALEAVQTKWGARLDGNQKVILEGLARTVREGRAGELLAKAREFAAARKVREAIEAVAEIMSKYGDTQAAREAVVIQAEVEEGSVLRVCTFEQGTQRPWRWTPAGAGFALNDDPQFVKEGKYSGVATFPTHNATGTMPCIRFPTLPKTDWSNYTAFSMWVYAPERTGDKLGIRVFVRGEEAKFAHDFVVDWQGWKEVRVPFGSFQAIGAAGWNAVQEIAIPIVEGKGGNYYFDDLRVTREGN